MSFKQLIRLYENEIVFQHPGEDEEKRRDYLLMFKSIPEFETWFKKNESNLVWNEEAQGYDSNVSLLLEMTDLIGIPVQFNIVNGNFICRNNSLTSLEGCPREVKGIFSCQFNNLSTLKGGPLKVKGTYNCSLNTLKDLKGCPEIINGNFFCNANDLMTLEGCPKEVKRDFNCSMNPGKFTEKQVRAVCNVRGNVIVKDSF